MLSPPPTPDENEERFGENWELIGRLKGISSSMFCGSEVLFLISIISSTGVFESGEDTVMSGLISEEELSLLLEVAQEEETVTIDENCVDELVSTNLLSLSLVSKLYMDASSNLSSTEKLFFITVDRDGRETPLSARMSDRERG